MRSSSSSWSIEEPGEDEEDGDAEVAAAAYRGEVEHHDEEDRDAAKAVESGPVLQLPHLVPQYARRFRSLCLWTKV